MVNLHPRDGPRFVTGAGPWSNRQDAHGSDSSTERDYHTSTASTSGPSSYSHSNPLPLSTSHVPNGGGIYSPDPRLNGTGSVETSHDLSPGIPHWSAKRHLTCGNPSPPPSWSSRPLPWRGSAPGKLKTANAALVICLNIDVDPPDVVKTNPCATLEAWVDPHTMPSHKALEAIGSNLQHQFEGLSSKMPYKPILDPCIEDLTRFCRALRKTAKDDAVLFYYNGHGVPKPTASGELWCFNKSYTQYIPVSLSELQSWLGSPGVYIWDCSAAGNLLTNFNLFAERRDQEMNMLHGGYVDGSQPFMNSIQLAACLAHESLPSCPELPADLFTSCLTSPIDIALRFFIMNHQLPNNITADMVMQVPGDLKDRRTPLGELNWIFTAITDTIAWTTFPRDLFTRLYRCDLLIASLFRNFLLAERIMKNYHCTPHTYPPLPPTNTHPMWAAWDLALDTCLRQLPDLLNKNTIDLNPPSGAAPSILMSNASIGPRPGRVGQNANTTTTPGAPGEKPYVYVPSRFFTDQLKAFEVWISRGGSALTKRGPLSLPMSSTGDRSSNGDNVNGVNEVFDHSNRQLQYHHSVWSSEHLVPRKPPDQLPIVLQVLLSQPHRLRALILLSQFVDLGPWAVHLVLSIGIFPYISKLLGAAGTDLRPVLIFIWARILAVDPSVQTDLFNTSGYLYFSKVLGLKDEDPSHLPNSSEHKAMCAFILSAISRDFPHGQQACWNERVFDHCYDRLSAGDFLLRQWAALCIAQMWCGNDEVKVYGVDRGTQDALIAMLSDDSAEVRCAALYALGTFLGASGSSSENPKPGGGGSGSMFQLEERIHFRMEVAVVTGATLAIKDDASPMCRKELLVLISCLVKEWRGYFVVCAWLYWEEDRRWRAGGTTGVGPGLGHHGLHDEDVTGQAVADWLDGLGDDEMFREENRVLLSSIFTIFVIMLDLSVDPYHEVAANAQTIIDYIMALLLESPFTRLDCTTLEAPPSVPTDRRMSPQLGARSRVGSLQSSPTYTGPSINVNVAPPSPASGSTRPGLTRSDTMTSSISSGVTNTIRRTSSFANALKSLAGGIAFPSIEDGHLSTSSSATVLGPGASAGSSGGYPAHKDLMDVSRPPSPNLNLAQYTSPYSRPSTPPKGMNMPRQHSSSPRSSSDASQSPMDFLPCDVMEALFEEDMERLRARRRAGLQPRRQHQHQHHAISHHGGGGGGPNSPCSSTFSMDSSSSSVILGLGTGVGIRDVLPLRSNFYDWCCEYFTEPQMRQTEADEPGSIQYNYQVWRQQRNEHVMDETGKQAEIAEHCRWDRPVTSFQVHGHPLTMVFHAYDQHLVIANDADMISVWDWSQKKRLNYFCNGNPRGASITSLHIINQDVGGIILTGSADGVVRLYRNYDPATEQGPVQMVSSFRGLNELIQLRQGSGLITDWKQSGGTLLVGGDSRIIRVWDAHTESQILDLDTNSDSPVTAIVSDHTSSSTFIASFADGVVKVFDRRLEEEDAIVRSYSEHVSWVQNVRWHPTLSGQFLSAGLDGEVKLWDLRASGPGTQSHTWNLHSDGLSAFDVHARTNVFAVTSTISPAYWRSQRVVVHSMAKELSKFNVSTGLTIYPMRTFSSPCIPRSSSLVFHPIEMLYGLGEPDGTVRILGCKLT